MSMSLKRLFSRISGSPVSVIAMIFSPWLRVASIITFDSIQLIKREIDRTSYSLRDGSQHLSEHAFIP
jgi:hypothetical protein